jgi:NADPH-dependent 2,4-dienoyl-CoA reductase/sulfur reductase-like enzyme
MMPVAIIGAGPAGATAARLLADAGVTPLLIDDNREVGGQIWRVGPALQDVRGDALRASVADLPRRRGAQVVDIAPGRIVLLDADEKLETVEAEAILIASGALEQFLPVTGWTRPGVHGLGGLQILMKAGGLLPKGPVLLAGAGPLLYLVGAQLVKAGVELSAVIDRAGLPSLPGLLTLPDQLLRGIGFELTLRRAGVPVLRRTELAEIGEDWAVTDRGERFPASVIGLGYGLRPNIELFSLLGCALDHDPVLGGWYPRRSDALETSVPGIFAVGDCAGIGGVEMALAEAPLAASGILRRLGQTGSLETATAKRRRARVDRFRRAVGAWSALPAKLGCDDRTLLCRCERVSAGAVREAISSGLDGLGPVKMATRAAMGLCQGRVCSTALSLEIASTMGGAAPVAPPSLRRPLRPVPIAAYLDDES